MVFQNPTHSQNQYTITLRMVLEFMVLLIKNEMDEIVATALKAGLFEEVKDRLDDLGTSLSGGQQQRLCIARAIAVKPDNFNG